MQSCVAAMAMRPPGGACLGGRGSSSYPQMRAAAGAPSAFWQFSLEPVCRIVPPQLVLDFQPWNAGNVCIALNNVSASDPQPPSRNVHEFPDVHVC